MVTLKSVEESNAALHASTEAGMVSLFVGATSGIALNTMLEYARNANEPKIYVVGRNESKLSTVASQLKTANPQGIYKTIKSEISLLKNVDKACQEFQRAERSLDLLVMCPGYLKLTRRDNADGLEDTVSLRYYVRMLFVKNLLPQLSVPRTARILSIHGAGKEGRLIEDDLELKRNFSLANGAMHTSTMNSLALRELAATHPTISCIHAFPGIVITPNYNIFAEEWFFPLRVLFIYVFVPILKLFTIDLPESGKRHAFHSTSARYPPSAHRDAPEAGVPMPEGVHIAKGADGNIGSGCYLLDEKGEATGNQLLLDEYQKKDMGKKIWEHTNEVFDRVLG